MHIRSVSIVVPDPYETATFLRDVLDLPISTHEDAVHVQIGTSVLVLVPGETEPNGFYHLAFEIPENAIIPARDLLRSRTALLLNGDEDIKTATADWNSHSVYFNAPGNLNLELIARHRQPNAISTPLTFADIQYISEVGIPVTEPLQAIGQVREALGIEPFISPIDTFAPMGTDDGLIILVQEGRIWYPTEDQTTTSRPLTVTVDSVVPTLMLTPQATIRSHEDQQEVMRSA